MIDLAIADAPRMEWPEHCALTPLERAAIEQQHFAPLQQRRDEVGELRAVIARQDQRIAAMEQRLSKLGGAYNRSIKQLGDAVDGLSLLMFGEPETLPKGKDELDGFELNIVKMIRAISYNEACKRKMLRDCGDWDIERAYHPGAMVEHDGAQWICKTAHTGVTPNHGSIWRRAPGVYWRGVWDESVQYHRGDSVISSGSSFVCKQATTEKPGTSEAWGMSSKRGRDGRDLTREQRAPVLK